MTKMGLGRWKGWRYVLGEALQWCKCKGLYKTKQAARYRAKKASLVRVFLCLLFHSPDPISQKEIGNNRISFLCYTVFGTEEAKLQFFKIVMLLGFNLTVTFGFKKVPELRKKTMICRQMY